MQEHATFILDRSIFTFPKSYSVMYETKKFNNTLLVK